MLPSLGDSGADVAVVVVVLSAAVSVVAMRVSLCALVDPGQLWLDPAVAGRGRVKQVAATADRGPDGVDIHFSRGSRDIDQICGFDLSFGLDAGNDASGSNRVEERGECVKN